MKSSIFALLSLLCFATVANVYGAESSKNALPPLPGPLDVVGNVVNAVAKGEIITLLPKLPDLSKLNLLTNPASSIITLSFGPTSAGLDLAQLMPTQLLKNAVTPWEKITKALATVLNPKGWFQAKTISPDDLKSALVLAWLKEAGYYGLKELSTSLDGTGLSVTEFLQKINMTLAAIPAEPDFKLKLPFTIGQPSKVTPSPSPKASGGVKISSPKPSPKVSPSPATKSSPKPSPKVSPTPGAKSSPKPSSKSSPKPSPKSSPKPVASTGTSKA